MGDRGARGRQTSDLLSHTHWTVGSLPARRTCRSEVLAGSLARPEQDAVRYAHPDDVTFCD